MASGTARGPRLEDSSSTGKLEALVGVAQETQWSNPDLQRKFGWLSAFTGIYALLAVLFGAFVRVSKSGDGCGSTWPDCRGSFTTAIDFSSPASTTRLIELTHRHSFDLLGLLVVGCLGFAYLKFPKGSPVRRASTYAFLLTAFEAILGMVLVKNSWVNYDNSVGRAVTMPLHLVNTYLLTANLGMMAYFGFTGRSVSWKNQGVVATALKGIIGGFFVLGCTGAISALGKTAYELELAGAKTFADRVALHLSQSAPPLLRGGLLHPLVATTIGVLVVWLGGVVVANRPSPEVKKWSQATIVLYALQFVFGIANLVASAPAWMQIAHLALALLSWFSVVILCASALGRPGVSVPESQKEAKPERPSRTIRQVVSAYVAVTKPRVISLLLFTTLAAMVVAQKGWPNGWLVLAVMVGGYFSAGAANAFNMVVETDLDGAMERTSKRPSVTGVLSLAEITWFAWGSAIGSFALLWAAANLLTALMALCGLLTYVFVYTLWLKRRTWQNIVIGGAAGAFPPLVGYAAISGSLSPLAWFLFLLIFTWTPVHFWALALLIKDDYAKANVPMLPVVKGDRVTVIQIMVYAVLTCLLCIVPFVQKEVGLIYVAGAGLLNVGLLVQSWKLFQTPGKTQARALFKFSMVYLALIFVVVAFDGAMGKPVHTQASAETPQHVQILPG